MLSMLLYRHSFTQHDHDRSVDTPLQLSCPSALLVPSNPLLVFFTRGRNIARHRSFSAEEVFGHVICDRVRSNIGIYESTTSQKIQPSSRSKAMLMTFRTDPGALDLTERLQCFLINASRLLPHIQV